MNELQISYEKDFYAWLLYNASLLRKHEFTDIDIENVAEELESMARSERRELINRLIVLLMHLLKWQIQVDRRSKSWIRTIKEQRKEVIELLDENPSLKPILNEKLIYAYERAVIRASDETGLNEEDFPKDCPFSLSQIFNNDFFPA